MSKLPTLRPPALEADIAALARSYRRANGPVMALVNRLGGGIEAQMALLPDTLRAEVERVVARALSAAHGLAGAGRRVPDMGGRAAVLAAVVTGAAGGAGGLPSAIAELPVTIVVMMHAIRREAQAAGYDPDSAEIKAACLEVFAAGSPLAGDDGVNSSFLTARLTLTGPAIQKIIATVAPRQAVAVLGAVTGAALNAAYLTYYREIARIRFALMRLAELHGAEAVLLAFARATRLRWSGCNYGVRLTFARTRVIPPEWRFVTGLRATLNKPLKRVWACSPGTLRFRGFFFAGGWHDRQMEHAHQAGA